MIGLSRDEAAAVVLLAPEGGRTVTVDGIAVELVSTRSPLGSVLSGLAVDDAEEVDTPSGVLVVEVRAIR